LKIIGFVGLPGSGKSVASDVAREMGLTVLVMGDVIRLEAARLGLQPSDESLGMVGNMLRAQDGPQAVARKILDKAKSTGEDMIIVDGLRSKAEADFFRAHSEEFHLVEIHAPGDSRLRWIKNRGRSDDPVHGGGDAAGSAIGDKNRITGPDDRHTVAALAKRDDREQGWGICEAILEADLRISNEGDLQSFRRCVQMLLEELSFGSSKKIPKKLSRN
jgi:dephospho-CoA kinase